MQTVLVGTAKRKLKQIEAAESAATTDDGVLRYAYDVGTKFGVTAPDSWTLDSAFAAHVNSLA